MPTSYMGNIKTLLMRGKIFRQQGSKLSGKHYRKQLNTITHSGSGISNYMSGTIRHRPLNPDLNNDFERFRISSGQGISQNAVNGSILASLARIKNTTKKKSSAKKSSAKKKGNFKSLKFNF